MFMFLRNFVKMYYIYWRVSIGTFALEGVPSLPHTSIALSNHKNNSILLLQKTDTSPLLYYHLTLLYVLL